MTTLTELAAFPGRLRQIASAIAPDLHTTRPADGSFALVEHAWHLADLEEEYGLRLTRLLSESNPSLPDFRGDAIAEQRGYLRQSLEEGSTRFENARARNLALIQSTPEENLIRAGEQEGAGRVTFARVVEMMAEHDASHAGELNALVRELGTRNAG